MTTKKDYTMKNGDILCMKTNVGASPRYFKNDGEISMADYYFYLTEDNVEKNLEVVQAAQSTYWTLLRKFFGKFSK
jgi:hypothetical protein